MSAGTEAKDRHWRKTRNLTIVVLILWALFALIVPAMTGWLNNYTFLGFPLGFYMIAHGSLIAFVVLIWIQNWRQDSIDKDFGFGDEA